MNRRVSVRRVGTAPVGTACIRLLTLSILMSATAAVAQPAAGGAAAAASAAASIPANVKSAPSAQPFSQQIQQFIQGQLQALTGEDPAVQKAAREKLIAECTAGSTQSYFDLYGQLLSDEIAKLFQQPVGKSLRTRLNIAVVVEAVATTGKTAKVEPAVILLINDPLEPVAMKGMQAAKPVLAVIYQTPNLIATDKLVQAILPAIKNHAKPAFPNDEAPGYLVWDAYRALIPVNSPDLAPAQAAAAIPFVLDTILDILDFRVTIYTTALPSVPNAESPLPAFFSKNFAGPGVNPKQQLRIVQALVNVIEVAGQQLTNASKQELQEVIPILKNTAQTLIVVSPNAAAAQSVLQPILQLSPGTPASQVPTKTKGVFAAMQLQFKDLKQPPAVTIAAPTTASSAPAPH